MKTQTQKTDKKRSVVKISLLVLLVFGGLFAFFVYDFFYSERMPAFTRADNNKPLRASKINILLIGYDSKINGPPRSDTLMLASFDIKEKAVGILSIPRDTRALIPGHRTYSKINVAFAEGGPEKAVQTVSDFLGVNIDYYIATDFSGFETMIDTMGGIELDVKKGMDYSDKAGGFEIHINAGKQILNGEQALGFVRFRDEITADIGRIQRQQDLIHAAMDQFLTPEILLKGPTLAQQFQKSVNTNMSISNLLNLSKLMKDIKREDLKTATIPGVGEYVGDVAYFIHDEKKTMDLVHDLIASKEFVANSKFKVVVFNGNGVIGVAGATSDNLKLHGFNVIKVVNANNYDYEKTQVVYTKKKCPEIESLAKMINGELIPFSESTYANETYWNDFDVLVILGKDFQLS